MCRASDIDGCAGVRIHENIDAADDDFVEDHGDGTEKKRLPKCKSPAGLPEDAADEEQIKRRDQIGENCCIHKVSGKKVGKNVDRAGKHNAFWALSNAKDKMTETGVEADKQRIGDPFAREIQEQKRRCGHAYALHQVRFLRMRREKCKSLSRTSTVSSASFHS